MSVAAAEPARLESAQGADLGRIASLALDAELFETPDEFDAFAKAYPWKVLVADEGEIALVDAWREHLPWLHIRSLWVSSRRIPALIAGLRRHAAEQGFTHLVTSPIPIESVHDYERGGMHMLDRLVLYRRRLRGATHDAGSAPAGMRLRAASAADMDALLALDALCFEPTWRADSRSFARHLSRDRIAVVETLSGATHNAGSGTLLGYTLAILGHVEGSIGRLAVAPAARGRGLGSLLLEEAVTWTAAKGMAGVTLCTQRDNATSRRMYERSGFRRIPGDLALLLSDGTDVDPVQIGKPGGNA